MDNNKFDQGMREAFCSMANSLTGFYIKGLHCQKWYYTMGVVSTCEAIADYIKEMNSKKEKFDVEAFTNYLDDMKKEASLKYKHEVEKSNIAKGTVHYPVENVFKDLYSFDYVQEEVKKAEETEEIFNCIFSSDDVYKEESIKKGNKRLSSSAEGELSRFKRMKINSPNQSQSLSQSQSETQSHIDESGNQSEELNFVSN